MRQAPFIIIIMGVAGSGKTTIGKLLAAETSFSFYDGDNFHTGVALSKMSGGTALSDDDRAPWLQAIRDHISRLKQKDEQAIIACSALKKSYRQVLRNGNNNITFIYLKGSRSIIAERIKKRTNHFMPPGLLESQFETLEEPRNAMVVDISKEPAQIIQYIIKKLSEEHCRGNS